MTTVDRGPWIAGAAAFVLGIIALVAPRSTAERLPVRILTTADGLPRDQVSCAFSDERGFLWFCAVEGLIRFDGRVATIYGGDQGLNPPSVRSFFRSRSGRYWVAANAGLFEFRPNSGDGAPHFRAVPRDDGERTGTVNALAEAPDGALWLATGRGLLLATHEADRDHLREVEIGLPQDNENDRIVRAVLVDEKGVLWIGAESGLYERRAD